MQAGDVHPNPGPNSVNTEHESSSFSSTTSQDILTNHLSIFHLNVQSMLPKIDLIRAESELYEPRREKTSFLHMQKQRRRSASQISAFVFATGIVQSLYYLNPKFQASSHLLWLHRPVCVGPGRKPRRPVFSERGHSGLQRNLAQTKHIRYRNCSSEFLTTFQSR